MISANDEDKAYNGHDAKLIDSRGLSVLGIEHSKNKMVGRGALLDIARFREVELMQDGDSISNDEFDICAKDQNACSTERCKAAASFALS